MSAGGDSEPSWVDEWIDPERKAFWRFPYSTPSLVLLGSATLLLFVIRDSIRSALWFIDGVNLFIHEAGHLIFGALGIALVGFLGGTLMQLAMPTAFFLYFLRRAHPKSADVCLFWIAENLLNVGRYMADARSEALPLLIEGSEHDWAYIFGEFGLLQADRVIGGVVDMAGCALLALSFYGIYIHARKGPGR